MRENLIEIEEQLKKLAFHGKMINDIDQVGSIGGIDISYPVDDTMLPVIGYSVTRKGEIWDWEKSIIHTETAEKFPEVPYMPMFLGHREAAFMTPVIEKINLNLNHKPDVILVDGNGYLHSRRFGNACHVFKRTGIPTIGVAKNLLNVEGVTPNHSDFKNQISSELKKYGDRIIFKDETSNPIAAAVRTSKPHKNQKVETCQPIFISIGGGINNLDLAIEIVLSVSNSKIPEPIRQSDLASRKHLKNLVSNQSL